MKNAFALLMVTGTLILSVCAGAQTPANSQEAPSASPSDLPVPVKSSDGKWGYQDKTGTYVIPPQYDRAEDFSEGVAAVGLKEKFGYIDSTGHVVIPLHFAHAGPFSEGLALVYTTWGMNLLGEVEGVWLFARAGYIDHKGKFVIKPRLVENASDFSQGLAAFEPGPSSWGSAKWGYLDKTGKWAIKPQFDIAGSFSEGLAPVAVLDKKSSNREKWGYIDQAGKLQIPAQFDNAGTFHQGVARVFLAEKDAKFEHLHHPQGDWGWRCIDRGGTFVDCPARSVAPNRKSAE